MFLVCSYFFKNLSFNVLISMVLIEKRMFVFSLRSLVCGLLTAVCCLLSLSMSVSLMLGEPDIHLSLTHFKFELQASFDNVLAISCRISITYYEYK